MLRNYAPGADLTLLNTMYLNPKKGENGKYDKGSITLMYKDNLTGIKHCETIDDPDYEFYVANDNEKIEHNMLFIEQSKVHKVNVPYNQLDKSIAEITGNMEFYYDNIKSGNRYANKQLHMDPRIFSSDAHIEDHYRARFSKIYSNNIIPISKAYFDIEADTIKMKSDFPEPGECPVNAVTLINDSTKKVYTLLLRNSDNPLIQQFEDSISNKLFDELKSFVRDKVGGWKNEVRFGLQDFQYELMFYDEEIKLIHDLFILMNVLKPDFILAWNMSFDMIYLIERIRKLGYKPEDIICHPAFKYKVAEYYKDMRNENEFAERGDYANISSYSVFLDQLIHFASRRKGQSAFQSFSLDFIGTAVTGVKKLDYSHITTSIAKLPYLDYKTFVFYNIMDTIVQKCIEVKVGDIDYIFGKCIINNTRYHKGHRQTVYLVNRGNKEFYKDDNFIMGNNSNRNNAKPDKFPGAFIADPLKLSDYSKIKIAGRATNLLNNLDDYDYKALYPSLMREMNIAPNTQIGMIEIPDKVYDGENRFNRDVYTRGSAFVEDMHSHVWLEFCHRWLHLADYGTLYKDIIDYYTTHAWSAMPLRWYNQEGQKIVVRFNETKQGITPIVFIDDKIRVVDFYNKPNFEAITNHFKDVNKLC